MLQQLRRGGSPFGVLLQADCDEVPKCAGEMMARLGLLCLQLRRRILQSHHQHLHWGVLGERCVAVAQLEHGDAQAPDVGVVIVPCHLLHHLGRHPTWGAHEGAVGLGAGAPRGGGDSEVCELHGAVGVDEDVAGFDVAVDVAVAVEVVQRLEHLLKDSGDGGLVQALRVAPLHDVERTAARQERHHHPQELSLHEGAVHHHQVRVRHHAHGRHLAPDLLQVPGVLVLQIHHLHCHRLIEAQALGAVHLGTHALPDFLQQRVVLGRGGVLHLGGLLEEAGRARPGGRQHRGDRCEGCG
mmetsp:Transcript_27466/g.68789  ORF Transcript_27466/g.68789 Transcript_27466/m.68789 type:complete len:298 (+) Transcript_27466:469-1362(+)